MSNNSSQHGENEQARVVIQAEAVFRRARLENRARREARSYIDACRRTAIQRRLVMRMLKQAGSSPCVHVNGRPATGPADRQ